MNTYLFAWNPDRWNWPNIKEMISQIPDKKPIHKWKTNRKHKIGYGDNFLLVKLGNLEKSDKGIIGFGKIVSNVYKDKDVIKNIEQVNFVDLEFEKLSLNPLISLEELDKIDPNIHWTPEGNGNAIPASIFHKNLSQINKENSSILFEKKIYFPIIAETIDSLLIQRESVHQDKIVKVLIDQYNSTFEKISKNSGKPISSIAEDMVNYFSKELLQNSEIVSEWHDKYKLKQINTNESLSYSLAFNPFQDEIISNDTVYKEGSIKQITINAYERNPEARKKCLKHWKYKCQCCGFDFEKTYGEIGKNFIHVHHKKPLSEIREEYELDPINDLIPVCANCHAMIHRKIPAYEIEEIKFFLEQNKSKEL